MTTRPTAYYQYQCPTCDGRFSRTPENTLKCFGFRRSRAPSNRFQIVLDGGERLCHACDMLELVRSESSGRAQLTQPLLPSTSEPTVRDASTTSLQQTNGRRRASTYAPLPSLQNARVSGSDDHNRTAGRGSTQTRTRAPNNATRNRHGDTRALPAPPQALSIVPDNPRRCRHEQQPQAPPPPYTATDTLPSYAECMLHQPLPALEHEYLQLRRPGQEHQVPTHSQSQEARRQRCQHGRTRAGHRGVPLPPLYDDVEPADIPTAAPPSYRQAQRAKIKEEKGALGYGLWKLRKGVKKGAEKVAVEIASLQARRGRAGEWSRRWLVIDEWLE
jgi:hypothetical protein